MTIWDLLPQNPILGPPLPRFLSIFWPWLQQSAQPSEERRSLSLLRNFQLPPGPFSASTYDNEEEWSWVDYKNRERKITVKRHAKQR